MVAAILPGAAVEAQAANVLAGTYAETTIPRGACSLTGNVSLSGSGSISGAVTIDLGGKILSGSAAPYFTRLPQ